MIKNSTLTKGAKKKRTSQVGRPADRSLRSVSPTPTQMNGKERATIVARNTASFSGNDRKRIALGSGIQ